MSPNAAILESTADLMDYVRKYRETVMSVSHYEDVYGEALVKNALVKEIVGSECVVRSKSIELPIQPGTRAF